MRSDIPTPPAPDPAAPAPARRAGRPAVWASAIDRNRAAGKRRTERQRLLTALQLALLNAWWDDAELQRTINGGDELATLQAFTAYFRRRHWMNGRPAEPPSALALPRDQAREPAGGPILTVQTVSARNSQNEP